ncbi:hypothetical protein ABKA04_006874 [Annulohypoxylon sp. FPYF3050]
MPIRVKSRRLPTPDRGLSPISSQPDVQLPDIEHDDSFRDVVKQLSLYITDAIYMPSTFEQLRTTSAGDDLRVLVEHLSTRVTNPAVVNALLALRWHYGAINDGRGISEARANACEIVAWRFLTRLSEREAVEFCLYEIPDEAEEANPSANGNGPADGGESNERTSLLHHASRSSSPDHHSEINRSGDVEELEDDPTAPFIHLNALEIAAIADAKRFLSQHVVQKIITGIWNGEIIFWDRLSVHSEKKPRFYNAVTADPFSRLRVPKYLKAYENRYSITPLEILLYIWFAAFFYDEVSEYIDAGSIFYAADVWNLFDMIMISIGVVFAVLRFVGLYKADYTLVDIAFDVLSLEALFMVPRVCSILSLSPYWGTLIPCLKEMGKDFLKFMVLVIIVYVGFLTTFSLVGREMYTFPHMAMIVTKIFFGSSYVGFDIMDDIDPIFGPPLMFIFVTLSSILLMGSLTGMLSNSFSRVITHAREEYLLTHFYPPFNLLALGIFRPLRLFLPSDDKFRQGRIVLLRATHAPIVGVIQAYEWFTKKVNPDGFDNFRGPRSSSFNKRQSIAPLDRFDNRSRSGFRRRMPTSRRTSTEVLNKPKPLHEDTEDFAGDAPSDMEVQISDLSAKIDRLTALVASLQSGAGIETVRT